MNTVSQIFYERSGRKKSALISGLSCVKQLRVFDAIHMVMIDDKITAVEVNVCRKQISIDNR